MTPPSQPLVSLSAQVCSAAGPYTALHSVTLQWPVSCRPPGRMASLLNHSPVIEPELSFQRAQPTHCTPPNTCSGMSAKLPRSLVQQRGGTGCPWLVLSPDSRSGGLVASLCCCVIHLLTHLFILISRWLTVGVTSRISPFTFSFYSSRCCWCSGMYLINAWQTSSRRL